MSELVIPAEVRVTGYDAFVEAVKTTKDMPQVYARTIDTVVPLAVAAELERLAKGRSMIAPEELQDRAAELRDASPLSPRGVKG